MQRDNLDADGATRNTCRFVDAKYATGNFYDPVAKRLAESSARTRAGQG
jgi:hypothetical protein